MLSMAHIKGFRIERENFTILNISLIGTSMIKFVNMEAYCTNFSWIGSNLICCSEISENPSFRGIFIFVANLWSMVECCTKISFNLANGWGLRLYFKVWELFYIDIQILCHGRSKNILYPEKC